MQFLFPLVLLISVGVADDPNRKISKCEACKFLAIELDESFGEFNSSEKMKLGYSIFDESPKSVAYRTSDTRLAEVLESVCRRMLQYNVHAERSGSNRYAKGQSQTMSSLWGLRNRGVKVVMDVPNELWDHPSAEISNLEKECNILLESNEDRIEEWYRHHQDTPIVKYLCEDYVLANEDFACLNETFVPEVKEKENVPTEENQEDDEADDSLHGEL